MQKVNKLLSCFLALMMILSVLPLGTMADGAETESVTVLFSAQQEGAFLFNRQEVTVTDGMAEAYGYTVAADGP